MDTSIIEGLTKEETDELYFDIIENSSSSISYHDGIDYRYYCRDNNGTVIHCPTYYHESNGIWSWQVNCSGMTTRNVNNNQIYNLESKYGNIYGAVCDSVGLLPP